MMKENKSRKKLAAGLIIVIIAVGIAALKIGAFLPTIGDADTPANSYVANYYITNAVKETHSYNIVTAVLADYRGFDTLFETCVLFLSALVTMMVLFGKEKVPKMPVKNLAEDKYRAAFGGDIMDASFRIVVPIILIYGIYVLFHGEISLGGGFQAGALIACAYLLDRIIPSIRMGRGKLKEETALIIASVGAFFYVITGILPMFKGGNFLEFAKLPFGSGLAAESIVKLHAAGILMIEVGVTICVMGVIIAILEVVLERTNFDD